MQVSVHQIGCSRNVMPQQMECHVSVIELHDNINAFKEARYDRHHNGAMGRMLNISASSLWPDCALQFRANLFSRLQMHLCLVSVGEADPEPD